MTSGEIPTITYPTILVAVFANQLCLPIPAVLFLITAGALVGSGSLNFTIVVLVGVVGCLAADYAWFMAERRAGSRVVRALRAEIGRAASREHEEVKMLDNTNTTDSNEQTHT